MVTKTMSYEISRPIWSDDVYVYGYTRHKGSKRAYPWIQLTDSAHKKLYWFLRNPKDIFNVWGFPELDIKRYEELQNFFDPDWSSGVKYLCYATAFEVDRFKQIVSWLLGPITETLKAWEVPYTSIFHILPPEDLYEFHSMTLEKGFITSKSKYALHDLLHGFSIDSIRQDSNYWVGDESVIDTLISIVMARESNKINNTDKQKMLNWLVGQVMKESKGTADPVAVKDKIKKLL